MNKRKLLFIILFAIFGIISLNIPLFKIIGSKQTFTFFDLFGPTTGMFLGPLFGAISVVSVKIFDTLINAKGFDLVTIIRLVPMPLAAIYFGSKSKRWGLIAGICFLLFVVHPIGQKVWYYALYWMIPILASFKKDRLILRSLGATFTAHAVGSTIFLYAFNLPAAVWLGLIPQVALERGIFAIGIWCSYLIFNSVLNYLTNRYKISSLKYLVNPQYIISKEFLKQLS